MTKINVSVNNEIEWTFETLREYIAHQAVFYSKEQNNLIMLHSARDKSDMFVTSVMSPNTGGAIGIPLTRYEIAKMLYEQSYRPVSSINYEINVV